MFALFALAISPVCQAQTLVTAPDNNGSGGVFINLQALSGPVTVTGFEAPISASAGLPVSVEVWVRSGSYAGFTSSNAGWTLTQTVAGITQGTGNRTPFVLTTPITVASPGVTAIYLHSIQTGTGLRYTGTSDESPQTTWSNADLQLFSDTARTGIVAFAGGQNSPRTFSGVIRYTKDLPTAPSNNGNGGVFLNLRALDQHLVVTGFDVPLSPAPGTQVSVEVWTRSGSYAGFTDSSTGWTLTQTVQAIAQGPSTPVPFVLTSPLTLSPAETTGLYLHAVLPAASGSGIRYTGTSEVLPQTSWSNNDLLLFSDTARIGFTPFSGSTNSPRTFSGSIRYTKAFTTAPSNNSSGGVFLNVQPVSDSVSLHGFDVPLESSPGTPTSIEVWTRPGSYVGFTGSNAGWTLRQTVSGVAQGITVPAPFLLSPPISLPADQTTAIYLHAVLPAAGSSGIRYTGTASLPPQTLWSNSEIVLFSDTARTGFVAFGGNQNAPRTFSGVLRYTGEGVFADGFEN
ncbi:MAG: hypothetical protein MEQ07_11895 [Aquimonas sp.]|nr:hypothetical protein [Aquimonas sp.]